MKKKAWMLLLIILVLPTLASADCDDDDNGGFSFRHMFRRKSKIPCPKVTLTTPVTVFLPKKNPAQIINKEGDVVSHSSNTGNPPQGTARPRVPARPIPPSRPRPPRPVVVTADPTSKNVDCVDCGAGKQETVPNPIEALSPDELCIRSILGKNLKEISNITLDVGCQNDSTCVLKAILDQMAKETGMPAELFYAVAFHESKWHHYNLDEIFPDRSQDEVGFMQISAIWHEKDHTAAEWAQIKSDPLVNARKGAEILEWAHKVAVKYNKDNHKNWNETELMRSTWAIYNGGAGAAERFEHVGTQACDAEKLKKDNAFNCELSNKYWETKLSPTISSCSKYDYGSNADPAPIQIKDAPVISAADDVKEVNIKQSQAQKDLALTIASTEIQSKLRVKDKCIEQKWGKYPNKILKECLQNLYDADVAKMSNMIDTLGCKTQDDCAISFILMQEAKAQGLPEDLAYAIAGAEAPSDKLGERWEQFRNNGEPHHKTGDGYGIMQVIEKYHTKRAKDEYGKDYFEYVKYDPLANIKYGINYAKSLYDIAVEKGAKLNWSKEEIYRSTYSMYNGGPGGNNYKRFLNPYDEWKDNDKNFYRSLTGRSWEKVQDKCEKRKSS